MIYGGFTCLNWSTRLLPYVPRSKVAIWGKVIPRLIENPCIGMYWEYKPYYWVHDHPPLYGKSGSLDPSTHNILPSHHSNGSITVAPGRCCKASSKAARYGSLRAVSRSMPSCFGRVNSENVDLPGFPVDGSESRLTTRFFQL